MKSLILLLLIIPTMYAFADEGAIDWNDMILSDELPIVYEYRIVDCGVEDCGTWETIESDVVMNNDVRRSNYNSTLELLPFFVIFSFIIVPIFWLYGIHTLNREKAQHSNTSGMQK